MTEIVDLTTEIVTMPPLRVKVKQMLCYGVAVYGALLSSSKPCLQDVLAICGGTLPAWTHRLVFGARFLFPFALRRAWFKTTALGLPRALAHLQVCCSMQYCSSVAVQTYTLPAIGQRLQCVVGWLALMMRPSAST